MLSARQRERLGQRVTGVICIVLILTGVVYLRDGQLEYPNWWGGRVFALFAIGIGALGLWAIAARRRTWGRKSK